MRNSLPKLLDLVKPATQVSRAKGSLQLMEHWSRDHKLLSYPTEAPHNIAYVGGERSYMMLGSLVKLERALMNWTMDKLVSEHGFTPVVVPNILYDNIVDRCGFPTTSARSQVYKISANNVDSILDENEDKRLDGEGSSHSCIAGTSEFALVSLHIGDSITADELPKRYCASSRCYRAETSRTSSEWGLYRVHYFNKVEMVALTMPDQSSRIHDEFLEIQRDIFSQLNLGFKVLEMPDDDLGLSAVKKYDIEAWMPARQRYGEVSSTSNCSDYQTSRLNITYKKMLESDGQLETESGFVHSVNGTACASIRSLIAIIEQHQTEDGRVSIPQPLIEYMDGIETIPTEEDRELLSELELYPTRSLTP